MRHHIVQVIAIGALLIFTVGCVRRKLFDSGKFSCVQNSDCVSIISYEQPHGGNPSKTLISCRNKYYPLGEGETLASSAGFTPQRCGCVLPDYRCAESNQ